MSRPISFCKETACGGRAYGRGLCSKHYQRITRRENGNVATHRYEKTLSGFVMRAYRNMKSRITGIQWRKAHLYEGKSLLSKDDFYEWAADHPALLALFKEWIDSGYPRKTTPSVDRIDSSKGYEVPNMRWVTHSENSSNTKRRRS